MLTARGIKQADYPVADVFVSVFAVSLNAILVCRLTYLADTVYVFAKHSSAVEFY